MNLTLTHFLFIALTLLFVIGGSLYSAASIKSAEGYSVSGRKAGVPLVAGSIAGTVVGGGATVGTAQLAYTTGLSAWWFTLGSGLAFVLMGLFYAGKLRRTGLETIPQYLKRNYGSRVAKAAGIISSLGILFSVVASCLPGIEITSALLGTSSPISALLLTALVAAYVFGGGLKSTGVGGILKMLVIWLSLFIAGLSAAYALYTTPSLHAALPTAYWLNMFNIGTGNALSKLFSMIVGVLCTQTYIQCIFSAANARTASIAAFVAAAIVIPVGLPSVAIGMHMHALQPDVVPVLVLPLYLIQYQPAWLAGIALGGILLSLVGSIGGLSLGISTMLTKDILARCLTIRAEHQLPLMRLMVICVILTACLIALFNLDSQVLFWNFMSMSLRGCGVFIPLTLAIFSPRSAQKKWVLFSLLTSTLIPVCGALFFALPIEPLYLGLGISALTMCIAYQKRWHPDTKSHEKQH